MTNYLALDMSEELVERVRVLYLNARNHLLRDEVMWRGTVDTAQIHVREIMARAMSLGASALIIAHNHPSGDPTPSSADVVITRKIAAAGRLMAIVVHDHIIVSKHGCVSMRAQNLF